MKLHELDALIKAVCPIEGINSNGIIWYAPEATQAERNAAQALMDEHLAEVDTTL